LDFNPASSAKVIAEAFLGKRECPVNGFRHVYKAGSIAERFSHKSGLVHEIATDQVQLFFAEFHRQPIYVKIHLIKRINPRMFILH